MAIFDTKYNQTQHECEIYLDNGIEQFSINPNAIVNLTIQDTLSEWVVRGTLSFYYYPEAGDELFSSITGQYSTAQTGLRTSTGRIYNFTNDGKDLLRIRVTPKIVGEAVNDFVIRDKTHWTLSYLFSIYDIEDVDLPPGAQNAASADLKCLKVYFWDYWYQKLNTNIMEYSTALSPLADIEGDKRAGIYSNYGMIPTGQAIKEIILKGLDGINNNPLGNEEAWDNGAGRLFYTAPAQTTAYESLMYVYEQHLSSTSNEENINDVSILIKERGPDYTDLGYFTLRPLKYYFEQSTKNGNAPGEWQIEHFFLQSYVSTSDNPTRALKAPISQDDSDTVDVKIFKYNQITNYRFVDIAALMNEKGFCTSPVYSYDFKNRIFRTDFAKNTVYKAKDYISQQYIEKLYKVGSSDDLFLVNLNEDKKSKNIVPMFSLYGDFNDNDSTLRQLPGIQKLLYLGVFQNAAVNFRVLGLTSRETGRFIAIDKTQGVPPGHFEDKFFGQWFIIDIKHIFEAEVYYNDITAVKVHRYQSLSNLPTSNGSAVSTPIQGITTGNLA